MSHTLHIYFLSILYKYITLLVNKATIRECANELGISVKTSFFMRHRILDCLNIILGKGFVSGIVESDDSILPDMYLHLYQAAVKTGADIVRTGFYRRSSFYGNDIDIYNDICMGHDEFYGKSGFRSKKSTIWKKNFSNQAERIRLF